jgi:hypothetical protein
MPGVMLAITERALPVLPGLTPVDRSERDEERIRWETVRKTRPQLVGNVRAQFKPMFARCIVGHDRMLAESLNRRC